MRQFVGVTKALACEKQVRILMALRERIPWGPTLDASRCRGSGERAKFCPNSVYEFAAAEVMGTGTLEARAKTTISPRIQERLAEVLVDQGDAVRSGQWLARLDLYVEEETRKFLGAAP